MLVAIVATLEICVLTGLKLNFANIIALPLLLGVGRRVQDLLRDGVAGGETEFSAIEPDAGRPVQRLRRPRPPSAALWFSHHPGTSSMGRLMALALLTTLAAAVLFQPALLATQRKARPLAEPQDPIAEREDTVAKTQ